MQIAFCKLLSAAQPMYFCSWQTAIYLYGTHTLASVNEKSLHINILMLELHNKVPGCFSLSPSLILLMTPSIPHTAHTVRRPRGDAGNMSQYPATGDWSKVRGAQEGGSVLRVCMISPQLSGSGRARQGSGTPQHPHRLVPDPETRSDHFTIINKQFIKIKTSWIKTHPELLRTISIFSLHFELNLYLYANAHYTDLLNWVEEHDYGDSWVIVNPSRSNLHSVIIMLSHWKENFIRVDSRRESVHFAPDMTIWHPLIFNILVWKNYSWGFPLFPL